MDTLLVRELGAELNTLAAEFATRREALDEYRLIKRRWDDAKTRLTSAAGQE
jgi:hypothetical protein